MLFDLSFETTCCAISIIFEELQQIIAINLRRKMKSRKTRIGIFVVFALQCRVECPSVAFFIVYLCPTGKYSSETIEKWTFSYTFLYCEKQFRYLILVCMFPIAGACAEFSSRPEIRRVALLPFLYSVIILEESLFLIFFFSINILSRTSFQQG